MKILITGGAGFIGSHLVDAYLAAGHQVVILDALLTAHPIKPPPGVELIQEDLRRCDLLKILNRHRFDVINHHAAQINVRLSLRDPVLDAEHNIIGGIKLLQAAVMTEQPIKRFIFASSGGAIYGSQKSYPTPEHATLKPESPYGLAKLTVENYMRFFQKTYGMKTVILRYSNVYGPRQDPAGEAGVISIFADLFLKNKPPTIYGDGAQTRDFVFVKDVARANVAALHDSAEGIFNIGCGSEISINDLADKIKALCRATCLPVFGSPIPGELERSCIDISKAAKQLDWVPRTSLETGLAETIQTIR